MGTFLDVMLPEKAIKACPVKGCSLTQRVAMLSLFLHRISVVPVNLFAAATTHGPHWSESTPDVHFYLLLTTHWKVTTLMYCYHSTLGTRMSPKYQRDQKFLPSPKLLA